MLRNTNIGLFKRVSDLEKALNTLLIIELIVIFVCISLVTRIAFSEHRYYHETQYVSAKMEMLSRLSVYELGQIKTRI